MDIKLADGTIVKNVPKGVTPEQVQAKFDARRSRDEGIGGMDLVKSLASGVNRLGSSLAGMADNSIIGDTFRAIDGTPMREQVKPSPFDTPDIAAKKEKLAEEYLKANPVTKKIQRFFEDNAETWNEDQSAPAKNIRSYVNSGKGFVDTAGRYLKHPSAGVMSAVESLPMMAPILLTKNAPATTQLTLGALHESAANAEDARQSALEDAKRNGATASQAVEASNLARDLALASTMATMPINAVGGVNALRRLTGRAATAEAKHGLAQIPKQMLAEAGQEFLQEGSSKVAQNIGAQQTYDQDRSATEGAAVAGLHGAVAGGIMGGAMGTLAVPQGAAPETEPTPGNPQPTPQESPDAQAAQARKAELDAIRQQRPLTPEEQDDADVADAILSRAAPEGHPAGAPQPPVQDSGQPVPQPEPQPAGAPAPQAGEPIVSSNAPPPATPQPAPGLSGVVQRHTQSAAPALDTVFGDAIKGNQVPDFTGLAQQTGLDRNSLVDQFNAKRTDHVRKQRLMDLAEQGDLNALRSAASEITVDPQQQDQLIEEAVAGNEQRKAEALAASQQQDAQAQQQAQQAAQQQADKDKYDQTYSKMLDEAVAALEGGQTEVKAFLPIKKKYSASGLNASDVNGVIEHAKQVIAEKQQKAARHEQAVTEAMPYLQSGDEASAVLAMEQAGVTDDADVQSVLKEANKRIRQDSKKPAGTQSVPAGQQAAPVDSLSAAVAEVKAAQAAGKKINLATIAKKHGVTILDVAKGAAAKPEQEALKAKPSQPLALPAPQGTATPGDVMVSRNGKVMSQAEADALDAVANTEKKQMRRDMAEEAGNPTGIPTGMKPKVEKPARTEQKAVLPHLILRTDGKPFPDEKQANRVLASKKLTETHEVVSVDGGKAIAPKKQTAKNQVDPEKDDILTAIAKLGGIDRAQAKSQGIDPADFSRRAGGIQFVFRKNGGKELDRMAEALSEMGYPVTENGDYTINALLDALDAALRGSAVGTPMFHEARARAEYEAQYEEEMAQAAINDTWDSPGNSSEPDWLMSAADDAMSSILDDDITPAPVIASELEGIENERRDDGQTEGSGQEVDTRAAVAGAATGAESVAGRRSGGQQEGQGGAGQDSGSTGFQLTAQTEAERLAEEQRQAADLEAKRKEEEKARLKAQADREISSFTLTGSDRPADVAMAAGQKDLFGPRTRGEKEAEKSRPKTDATISDSDYAQVVEAARYLKDIVYSLQNLIGDDSRLLVELSSDLGKSGRDTILMDAFGIDRSLAHTIHNRLDDSRPHKLRAVDMEDAFTTFPMLKTVIDNAKEVVRERDERMAARDAESKAVAIHTPGTVKTIIRARNGGRVIGIVSEAHNGTMEDMLRIAKAQRRNAMRDHQDAGDGASITFAEENGSPKWRISLNGNTITELGKDEAARIASEESNRDTGDKIESTVNSVMTEVRSMGGDIIGVITDPYSGNRDEIMGIAQSQRNRMFDRYPDASNMQSTTIATDGSGRPAWRVRPNMSGIEQIGQQAKTVATEVAAVESKPEPVKWFGSRDKADAWIAKVSKVNGGDYHVIQAGPSRFEVFAGKESNAFPVGKDGLPARKSIIPKSTPDALLALTGGDQIVFNSGTEFEETVWIEENRARKTWVIKTRSGRAIITEGPVGPDRQWGWGKNDAAAKAVEGKRYPSNLDAPGTRYNTSADRAAAERLQKLLDSFMANRGTPEGAARDAIRSVIEELRKPKTTSSIVSMLETASNRLMRQFPAQAEVVDGVIESLGAQAAPAEDLDSMFDDVLAEVTGKPKAADIPKASVESAFTGEPDPKNSAPMQELGGFAVGDKVAISGRSVSEGVIRQLFTRQSSGGEMNMARVEVAGGKSLDLLTDNLSRQERTAGQAAASAVKNTGMALGDAIDGLGKLFGGNGKLNSGLTFDKETYAKAKPYFIAAISHLKAAGSDLRETMRAVIKMVVDKFGVDAAENMKPYVVQFISDVRDGKIDDPAATLNSSDTNEATGNDVRKLDTTGQGALEGVPSGEVQGAATGRGTGSGAAEGGRGDGGADGSVAGAGSDRNGGMGNSSERVPVSGTGAGGSGRGRSRSSGGNGRAVSAQSAASNEQESSGGLTADANQPSMALEPGRIDPPQLTEDFIIEDDLGLGEGGQRTKYKNNVEAIRLIRDLEASGRTATTDEQKVLAKYVGWGGIPQAFDPDNKDWSAQYAELKSLLSADEWDAAFESTQYAHYTSREIINGMYAAVRRLGFNGGNVLEAGGGVGNFIGLMPVDLRTNGKVTLVEREAIAAAIAKHLYPRQNIRAEDFTEFGKGQDGQYDMQIGNPPFSSNPLTDKSGRKHLTGLSVHNYFITKGVDMLRDGGIMAVVVSNSFMDAGNVRAREYIAKRAKLLGAIRLPNNAFSKNANTQVTTDIIFLQKLPESDWNSKAAIADGKRWVGVTTVSDPQGKGEVALNQYFADNMGMMLGVWGKFGTMYGPDQPALVARPGQDTAAMMARAVAALPEGVYTPASVSRTKAMEGALLEKLHDNSVGEGGFYVKDGKVWQRVADSVGEAYAAEITPNTVISGTRSIGQLGIDRLRQLAELRRTMRELLAAETEDRKADMDRLRKELNTRYDAYTADNGRINDPTTKRLMRDDPDYPLIAALEMDYEPGIGPAAAKAAGIKPQTSKAKKAAIFDRRVIEARKAVTKADSPQDAINISMAERGRLDAEYIGRLLDVPGDEVLGQLASGTNPLLFRDPATDEYVLRDAYLSGNVREKLKQAKAAGLTSNARALEEVQPEDIPASKISVRIGSPWVPVGVYADFATSLFGDGTRTILRYVKSNGGFSGVIVPGSEVMASTKFGIKGYHGDAILLALMNNRQIKVMTKDGDGKPTVDAKATEEANSKADDIKQAFQDWIFKDADRAEVLLRAYNDANNNYVVRKYDGSWLKFPGKVPDAVIRFRRHQRNAIARTIQDRTTLYDHVVGAGKTFTAIASAMEMRRMGLVRKPLMVVPNHLVGQWASDFYRLYPGAKVLAATKKDFERENRRRFLAKIASGDWDAVIIAHSSFGHIRPNPEFEQKFTQAEIDRIMREAKEVEASVGDEQEKKRTVKQLAAMQERLENRIAKLREKPMDDLLDFQQLGVDQLFVDEAHLFKNLMFTTKMRNVRGLGDPTGSQRAYDMYIKTSQIMEQNGRGQGVVFMTGTPVSNSLAEMYHMMRYLMPDQMRQLGFESFDAWANTYAEAKTMFVPKTSGDGFKQQTRLSSFSNVYQLLAMSDQVTDTVTMDDIKAAFKEETGKDFPLPKLLTGRRQPVSMDKTPAQEAYMKDIIDRLNKLEMRKGPPKKGEDNHLTIMSDARKAAMDIRLVDMAVIDREKGARVDRASNEIFSRWKKHDADRGTQLVFADLGTPISTVKNEVKEYDAIMARIAAGEDPDTIAMAQLGDEEAATKVNDAESAREDLDAKGRDWLTAIECAKRGFSVYDDLKKALMEKGIPENQIAFIHSYNTDDQKAALFRKVNNGEIRILMGSTPKMGAGTNVQKRLVALHHLDVPWKPSDLEQREGRIIRQGNVFATEPTAAVPNPEYKPDFEVEILAYVTKDTLDAFMWNIQEAKLKGINQLRSRNIDDELSDAFEEMEMSAGEMQAAATGNMDMLREIQLRTEVQKLEKKQRALDAGKADAIAGIRRATREIERLPAQIATYERLSKASEDVLLDVFTARNKFKATINGKEYSNHTEAAKVLRDLVDAVEVGDDGKERKAKLDVSLNGEQFTNRQKLAEAFARLTGDNEPFVFDAGDGKVYRVDDAADAVMDTVASARDSDGEKLLGNMGDYKVSIEYSGEVFGGNFEEFDVHASVGDDDLPSAVVRAKPGDDRHTAKEILKAVRNMVRDAGSALSSLKASLEKAKKNLADLSKIDTTSEWPDSDKLARMREEHKALRDKMNKEAEANKEQGKEQGGELRMSVQSDTSGPGLTTSRAREILSADPVLSKALPFIDIRNSKDGVPDGADPMYLPAWHGSPYKFDKFSLEHIGKGEGAQAYGWGLYFAGRKEVAQFYRDALSSTGHEFNGVRQNTAADPVARLALHLADDPLVGDTIQEKIKNLRNEDAVMGDPDYRAAVEWLERNADDIKFTSDGHLYHVEIPDDDTYLLWDAPASKQSSAVKNALLSRKADKHLKRHAQKNKNLFEYLGETEMSGRDVYEALSIGLGSPEKASKFLLSMGISGIKYLDGTSRAKGDGSYNYVIFDDNAVRILETHYSAGDAGAEGYYHNGRITLFADNIRATPTQTAEERLKWVAFHEVTHRGVANLSESKEYMEELRQAGKNPFIKNLAKKIYEKRQKLPPKYHVTMEVAIEEALAETWAALQTGSSKTIKEQYGLHFPLSIRPRAKSAVARFFEAVKRIYSKLTGRGLTNEQVGDLLRKTHEAGMGPDGTNPSGRRNSFAGENSKTADLTALDKAKKRIAAGDNAEAVRKDTGWHTGLDGKWRFEIDDSKAYIKGKGSVLGKPMKSNADIASIIKANRYSPYRASAKLGSILHHPDLFRAYPDLANVDVWVEKKGSGSDGSFEPESNVLTVREDLSGSDAVSVIYHEIQHAIQENEGFAAGGNIRDMGRRVVEARFEVDDLSRRLQRIENEAGAEADLWVAKYPDKVKDALDYLRKQGMFDEGDNVRDAVKYAIHDRDPSYQNLTKQWRQAKEAAQQSPTESYRRLAGEVEARNTQSRANLTGAERSATSPKSTEDVAERDQIVKFSKGETSASSGDTSDIRYSAPPTDDTSLTRSDFVNIAKEWMFQKWANTLGTQLNTAMLEPLFKPTYDLVQRYLQHTSNDAYDAISAAPNLLGRLEDINDYKRDIKNIANYSQVKADREAAAVPLFEGTRFDKKVYSDAVLKRVYNLTDDQVAVYREARAAIEASLDSHAKSVITKILLDAGAVEFSDIDTLVNRDLPADDYMEELRQRLDADIVAANDAIAIQKTALSAAGVTAQDKASIQASIKKGSRRVELLEEAAKRIDSTEDTLSQLKREGYFPLMRWGKYTVTVKDAGGKVVDFRMVDGLIEREVLQKALAKQYQGQGMTVTSGTMDEGRFKDFRGVSPETLALFAKELGVDNDEAYQEYLKLALPGQSALKRRIHRKGDNGEGIAGFSMDIQRTLAAFVMGNARHSARNIYSSAITKSVDAIPDDDGGVRNTARKLAEFVMEPDENSASVSIRNMLFIWNMGGSVAFAALNLTQPWMMTLPWLSQFSGIGSVVELMGKAAKTASAAQYDGTVPPEYYAEYQRAVREGIVDPQNVFMLQGVERGKTGVGSGIARTLSHGMGMFAAITESYNRKLTLFAALDVAKAKGPQWLKSKGFDSAYAFAKQAIAETQGVYNKGNRPAWARNPLGAIVLVFKQYAINWTEMAVRMGRNHYGDDRMRKGLMMMLGLLFAMAGGLGLPFADDLKDIAETAMGGLGKPVNIERQMQMALGKGMADAVLAGPMNSMVLNSLGLDMHGRMSMGNIVPITGAFNPYTSTDAKLSEGISVMGAGTGLLKKGSDAVAAAQDGRFLDAAQSAAPRAVESIMKGVRMMAEGKARDARGNVLMETTPAQAVSKMLDFQPASVAITQRERGRRFQDKNIQVVARASLRNRLITAYEEKDAEKIRGAEQALDEWNQDNPLYQIKLKKRDLRRAAKKRGASWLKREETPKGLEWMDEYADQENGQ